MNMFSSDKNGEIASSVESADKDQATMTAAQVASALRQAQAAHAQGKPKEAIEICEKILQSGFERPDARYFLSWLYQEEQEWEKAIESYGELLDDPEYALSCYYALGQCYFALGDTKNAVLCFDEAVDRVNLDALTYEECEQLVQLCHDAATAHRMMGEEDQAETVYSALIGFLQSRGWQDYVERVEQLISEPVSTSAQGQVPVVQDYTEEELAETASPETQEETLPEDVQTNDVSSSEAEIEENVLPEEALQGSQTLEEYQENQADSLSPEAAQDQDDYMQDIPAEENKYDNAVQDFDDSYLSMQPASPVQEDVDQEDAYREKYEQVKSMLEAGQLNDAEEDCQRLINAYPDFLGAHRLLSDVYVQQGKTEQAVTKLAILIDLYLLKDQIDDVIDVYHQILHLQPNNLTYRVRFIELLDRYGREQESRNQRMVVAESYLRLGYADKASHEFERLVQEDPSNITLMHNYASALMKADKSQEAAGVYQQILQVDPGNVAGLCRWQVALLSRNNVSDEDAATALDLLARIIRSLKGPGERFVQSVEREFTSAIDADPSNGFLRYSLGEIQKFAGNIRQANLSFEKSLIEKRIEVLSRVALVRCMDLYEGSAESAELLKKAIQELELAQMLVEKNGISMTLWAARPLEEGEEPLAPRLMLENLLSHLREHLEALEPPVVEEPAAIIALETDEISMQQGEVAPVDENEAREDTEKIPLVLNEVSKLRSMKKVDDAIELLQELSQEAPDAVEVHTTFGEILVRRGLIEEGLIEYRTAVTVLIREEKDEEAADILQQMANIYWDAGDRDQALDTISRVLQLTPDNIPARMDLVQYYIQAGMKDEAKQVQEDIAKYYYSQQHIEEAVASLQQLIAMDRSNENAYDMLGQVYLSAGEAEQALRVYRNLMKVHPQSQLALERITEIEQR